MATPCRLAAALTALLGATLCAGARTQAGARMSRNPIRRVVTMLQKMQSRITDEGKRDKELYEKFKCYCKNGAGGLEAGISDAEAKIPQLESSIGTKTGQKDQLVKELKQHKQVLKDAKEAVESATSMREEEAVTNAKRASELKANIAALKQGMNAIERGSTGFLQTSAASVVRQLTVQMDLSSGDRDAISSFLSEDEGSMHAGRILGIMAQMKDEMEKDLAKAVADEKTAQAEFASLSASKKKEIAATREAIESKLAREGQARVDLVALKADLKDTSESLAQDKKFLANLADNCRKKDKEWEEVQKARTDELLALAETIKILNDDDALELFKKTLPSTSLLQTQVTARDVRQRALQVLGAARRRGAAGPDPRLGLLALALRGRKASFSKVVAMIDSMLKLLSREQGDDSDKKAYCSSELGKTKNTIKGLTVSISDLTKVEADASSELKSVEADIASLEKGIRDLDASVKEATAGRKAEHKEFKADFAADTAAREILKKAANRMNQFYSKASRKKEKAAGLAQVSAGEGAGQPQPPPEAVASYKKDQEGKNGVMQMMSILIADLDKELTRAKVEEKDAQKEYEQVMKDSAAKRTADARSITEKASLKGELEERLEETDLKKGAAKRRALKSASTLRDLHLECDWLLANFGARKAARAAERDSLQQAQAILQGADYSLVQIAHVHHRA